MVKNPELTRVMQYTRDSIKLTLVLEPDDNPKWWVESSYIIHPPDIQVTQEYL